MAAASSATGEQDAPSTILRQNPLKDAIALTIIFYKLPPSLNCLLLMLYALSGSSRAIAGKLLAKLFRQINHERGPLSSGDGGGDLSDINDLMNTDSAYQQHRDKKKITYFELLSYVVNSGIVPLMIHFVISILIFYCSPNLLSLFKLLSKAMISASLFGIHGTRALTTSVLISFVIILAGKLYKLLLQNAADLSGTAGGLAAALAQFSALDSQLESEFFKLAYDYNIFNLLDFKNSQYFLFLFNNFSSSFWNFLNYSLSIHVILLEISPSFKNTNYIKSYINSLDQLARISPEYIPDEFHGAGASILSGAASGQTLAANGSINENGGVLASENSDAAATQKTTANVAAIGNGNAASNSTASGAASAVSAASAAAAAINGTPFPAGIVVPTTAGDVDPLSIGNDSTRMVNTSMDNSHTSSYAGSVNYRHSETLTVRISDDLSDLKLNLILNSRAAEASEDPQQHTENYEYSNYNDSPASFPAEASQEVIYSNYLSSTLSTVISNLENFCKIPFMTAASAAASSSLPSSSASTLSSSNQVTFNSLSTAASPIAPTNPTATMSSNPSSKKLLTKKLPNVRYQQPLWSIIAALFAMRKRPDIYSGELTISDAINETNNKNSLVPIQQDRYSNFHFPEHNFPIKCFIDYVGQTSIAFQAVHLAKQKSSAQESFLKGLDIVVLVNGIEWNTHTYNEEYIVIIGLTPSSTYDIEIFAVSTNSKSGANNFSGDNAPQDSTGPNNNEDLSEEDGYQEALIAKYIICTTSDDNGRQTFSSTKIESPLETLQKSVTTTKNSVIRERLKLKKMKKDNSKATSDLLKEIESLNKKIRESDKNDEKLWKKVALLKTETKNLEDEIAQKKLVLEKTKLLAKLVTKVYEVKKAHFDKQEEVFIQLEQGYNKELDALRTSGKQLENELNTITQKNEKLKTKIQKYENDIKHSEEEIKTMVTDDMKKRLELRAMRVEKRHQLINELRDEISKVKEMTAANQERVAKLEKEELEVSRE